MTVMQLPRARILTFGIPWYGSGCITLMGWGCHDKEEPASRFAGVLLGCLAFDRLSLGGGCFGVGISAGQPTPVRPWPRVFSKNGTHEVSLLGLTLVFSRRAA